MNVRRLSAKADTRQGLISGRSIHKAVAQRESSADGAAVRCSEGLSGTATPWHWEVAPRAAEYSSVDERGEGLANIYEAC
jgi:hypothetical protein